MNFRETRLRSLVKTLSWRALATLTTMGLVYLFTGEVIIAVEVGALEVVAKLLLFFLHERVWNLISWGKKVAEGE
ncbi:MAG: DUF2061 domain-containing protein [Thermoplasmata archaeon]|nr:DUF2061 domain-containing protein [Thermoplasmata archaeon]OYT49708.1 MAG: hypothetical protein B6U83_01570 [Thermoplasmatales archaeon ex4484_36]RLF73220.1 MAG: hypothetical protein DRN55_04240 [Thermoplasmata archaeon]RLF76614.1 MAG: hypothetical protein DRN42_00635 [Thermoplasmata archaeon]HDD60180.1 DUF2061 domain-containing protein [Euryarchaeota archaeon]